MLARHMWHAWLQVWRAALARCAACNQGPRPGVRADARPRRARLSRRWWTRPTGCCARATRTGCRTSWRPPRARPPPPACPRPRPPRVTVRPTPPVQPAGMCIYPSSILGAMRPWAASSAALLGLRQAAHAHAVCKARLPKPNTHIACRRLFTMDHVASRCLTWAALAGWSPQDSPCRECCACAPRYDVETVAQQAPRARPAAWSRWSLRRRSRATRPRSSGSRCTTRATWRLPPPTTGAVCGTYARTAGCAVRAMQAILLLCVRRPPSLPGANAAMRSA